MKKITFYLFTIVFCISCQKEAPKDKSVDLLQYTPNTPSIIAHATTIDALIENLSKNEFINLLQNTNSITQLQNEFSFINKLPQEKEVLIAFSLIGKNYEFLLATQKTTPNPINTQSTPLQYNQQTFYKTQQQHFIYETNDALIVASSELLIENLIRNQESNITYNNSSLNKLLKTNSESDTSIYINLERKPEFVSPFLPEEFLAKEGWTSFTLNSNSEFSSNGTATLHQPQNEYTKALSISSNGTSAATKILPYNYSNYKSYQYTALEIPESNFENFSELIASSNELVRFSCKDKNIIGFRLLENNVLDQLSEIETYRNTPIYQNTYYKIPSQLFSPQPQYACILDNFLLLSHEKEALQNTIAHFHNKTTVEHSKEFESTTQSLRESHINYSSTTSSILNKLGHLLNDKSLTQVQPTNYPYYNLQINYEENYTNLNNYIKKVTPDTEQKGAKLIEQLTLEAPVNPEQIHWVKNHRNNSYEILAQDLQNKLYLITQQGVVLWKKQLTSPIQGNITQVDLYKNRKLQIAFTTENEFMVLDRNGNTVQPFYKKFNHNNLNPLAVFDYDNNRNYRFVITHNNSLTMYNNKMEVVNGFKFKKASSEIINSPKHLRVGTKDYIVIAEKNGKLHLLNRQGKTRTQVPNSFKFDSNLTIHTKNNLLYFIDNNALVYSVNISTGKTVKHKLLTESPSYYLTNQNHEVILENQNLSINNKNFELDYGQYTPPIAHSYNNKNYINVTDIDTQKVYIFNAKAEPHDGFPVFGKSSIVLHQNLFLTQGEQNNILLYQL